MRSIVAGLVVAWTLAFAAQTAVAQNIPSQLDALLGAHEGVTPEQWRGMGDAARPILESIAADQHALPTRRARALDGLAALGSGEATMRTLANSVAAPPIVRMAAIRGLGQVLPEAALIEALRPLLQDAQSQVRGAAAETLSNTPAGCAVIAAMANAETAAWRARFARRCADSTNSAPTTVPDATLNTYDPTARVVVYRIIDPSATQLYEYPSTGVIKILPPTQLGSVAVLLPNSPTVPFEDGPWSFRLLASKPTLIGVEALIKSPSFAALTSGKLNANLFFVGLSGLSAASAPMDANFQTVLSNVNSIYAQIGVQLGDLKYFDVTGADATAYTDLDDANLGDLVKLSANPLAADGAINLFFVHSITGAALPGYIILGESAGIPGVPVRGTSGAGVAITMADFPNGLVDIASTIAHESGHWLGLFHTTESGGTAFDPLPDTPQCPKVPNDTNNDGIMQPAECAALDAGNLMFWTSLSGQTQFTVTPNQQFVMLRNPAMNVPDTQVTRVPLGSFDVNTGTLSDAVIADVPANAVSLTLVGRDPLPARQRRYVSKTAAGANDGTSWANAYTDLASALALETKDTDFWVAKGIYKPTAAANRSAAFHLKAGVAVYGGFAGTETNLGQRVIVANPTVLSGDIDNNDNGVNGVDSDTSKIVGNNVYHVVVLDSAAGFSSSTVLDGFTITGGKADAAAPDDRGGGLLCNTPCNTNLTLTNLYVAGNLAANVGGAFYDEGSNSPTVTVTTFSGNAASNGGAVYHYLGPGSAPTYGNVTFAGNSVSSYGGAMYNYQTTGHATLTMTNVTMSSNVAGTGGAAIANYTCGATLTAALTNMILWADSSNEVAFACDTPTFKNSVVQGSGGSAAWNSTFGIDGGGNLATDPKLGPLQDNGGVAPTLLPGSGSSAIDTGLDSACAAPPVNGYDERYVPRPTGAHCDSGAVEAGGLRLSVTDNSLYASGGFVDYVVTLTNYDPVATFNSVQVSSQSSGAIIAAFMSWTCFPSPPAGLCSSGSGTFNDTASLQGGASVHWNVHVPLLTHTNAATVAFTVMVPGVASVTDTDTLVLFRSDFE